MHTKPPSALRLRRIAAGLRILDVALATGIAPTRISQIERDDGAPARADELEAITTALRKHVAPQSEAPR